MEKSSYLIVTMLGALGPLIRTGAGQEAGRKRVAQGTQCN